MKVAMKEAPAGLDWSGGPAWAADHGIAIEAVSADPQAVTAGMVKDFPSGGGAFAVPILRLACSLHAGMATFAKAGETGKA